MATKPVKGKGGRPPKSEEGALTRTLAFRLRPALHEKLQVAAASEGRSLSEEVETRLGRSFVEEEIQSRRFGSPAAGFIANLIASATSLIELKTGKSFVHDKETFEAVKHAVEEILACATDILGDVTDIPAAQRRFNWYELKRIADDTIADAGYASISISDIMKR